MTRSGTVGSVNSESGVIRAQRWTQGSGFDTVEVPAEAADGFALAEIDLALVCGSDGHTVSGRRSSPSPSILGHESVGRVARPGPVGGDPLVDVFGDPVAEGDRIVWSVTATCGTCDRCRRGLTAKCRSVLKTGHEPTDGPWPLSGGYATHIALHGGLALVRVPDVVSDAEAAMSSCALATVMACLEAAAPVARQRVLVLGVGMLGVCAVAVARYRGAAQVTAVDVAADRLDLALAAGADEACVPDDLAGEFDVVIELSGAPSSVALGLAHAALGAVIVLAGSVTPGPPVPLDAERVTRSWWTIRGVHNYEARHLQQAVRFLAESPLRLDGIFADPVPLQGLPGLFEASPQPGLLRRAVCPRG